MKLAIAVILSAAAICSAVPASAQSKSTQAAGKSKTAASSASKAHAVSHSAHSRGRHSKARRASTPAYQTAPTPERYQEIQKALADRGYFKGEVNGQWGPDSVDALQRFEADQQIPNDGKINSLSLIGLGLGPKHGVGAVPQSAPPTPAGSEPLPPLPAETPDKPPTPIVPIPPK
jgi:hypothetical protein